jgi:hypothetical protein
VIVTTIKSGCPYELQEKYRRSRRGSVIEDETQDVVRADRFGRNGMEKKYGRFQAGTTGHGSGKSSGVPIKTLPVGFAGPTVDRFDGVSLRPDSVNSEGDREASGQTHGQGADGDYDQHNTPAASIDTPIFEEHHLAVGN